MRLKIYSWNNGEGSGLLAQALGILRIKRRNSRYVPRQGDCIINWGCTSTPYPNVRLINRPVKVGIVSNKDQFFRYYDTDKNNAGFEVPPYFFNRTDAEAWLKAGRERTLVARTVLAGHEGRGIVMIDSPDKMVNAQLYTGYVKKQAEYRVHVVNGKAIDMVQKKRRLGHTAGDARVRNTANGYVFARTDVVVPDSVRDSAVSAVKFFGLDFGAVDVIWNDHYKKAYVLEINTAPGIEGRTVQSYAEAFRNWLI